MKKTNFIKKSWHRQNDLSRKIFAPPGRRPLAGRELAAAWPPPPGSRGITGSELAAAAMATASWPRAGRELTASWPRTGRRAPVNASWPRAGRRALGALRNLGTGPASSRVLPHRSFSHP